MNRKLNCHCQLCLLEQKLLAELHNPQNQEKNRILFRSAPHLAAFATASDLLSHLQSLAGNAASDPLFSELLELRMHFPESVADSVFVLLFLPVLHSTVRRLRYGNFTLGRDDASQQVLSALFDCLASPRIRERRNYLAFAIARQVRRASFEWATRQSKSPLEAPRFHDLRDTLEASSANSFERTSVLRHFLARAVQRGTLTPTELNLLIQFKLEGGSENGAFSNAQRQRLKRLLAKLRKLATENRSA